jgi:hypothetical protein
MYADRRIEPVLARIFKVAFVARVAVIAGMIVMSGVALWGVIARAGNPLYYRGLLPWNERA